MARLVGFDPHPLSPHGNDGHVGWVDNGYGDTMLYGYMVALNPGNHDLKSVELSESMIESPETGRTVELEPLP